MRATTCVVSFAECTLGQTKRAQGSLRVCRDDSVSTFSKSVGSDSVDQTTVRYTGLSESRLLVTSPVLA